MALRAGCFACLDALLPEHAALPRGLIYVSPVSATRKTGYSCASPSSTEPTSTRATSRAARVLMLLAISQQVTPELVQTIIDRGADVHAKSKQGLNALDYAQRLGRQPIIDVLDARRPPADEGAAAGGTAIRRQQLGPRGGSAQPAAAANQQQDVLRPRRLRWLSSQPADRHHGAGGATHGIHRGRDRWRGKNLPRWCATSLPRASWHWKE